MQDQITDFTLKSAIRRIVQSTYNRNMTEPALAYHDIIISFLWNGINTPDERNQTTDIGKLVELLRQDFEHTILEDKGIVDGYQRYEAIFSNVRFYIVKLPKSYLVNAALPERNIRYVSCCKPEETVTLMRTFNDLIPIIHKYIEQHASIAARNHMVGEMIAASGKGIIDQVTAEEGVNVPPISSISGTPSGRVKVHFANSSETIDCPLNHLRARLLRRFRQHTA